MFDYSDFTNKFKILSVVIESEINKNYSYWEPESPPLTVLLSNIGKCLFNEFDNLDAINKKYLFKLIEEGMSSSDDRLANATATGLIEAIINNSTSNPEQWKNFERGLLKKSKEYALAFYNQ